MKNTKDSAGADSTDIDSIACPQCGKTVLWIEEEVYRPFCSRRCQMIDFGDWATEKNTIPADSPPDDWEDTEQS
jgi:endogenous inhibitor of DNA gyrase (YacG/DUF329 family)